MPAAKIGHGNSLWIPRIRNLYRAADWKNRGRRSPACGGTASRAVWPGVEASVFAVGQLWLRSGDRACARCGPGLSLGVGSQKTTDMNRCRMLVQCGNVGAAFRIGCERAVGTPVNAACRSGLSPGGVLPASVHSCVMKTSLGIVCRFRRNVVGRAPFLRRGTEPAGYGRPAHNVRPKRAVGACRSRSNRIGRRGM